MKKLTLSRLESLSACVDAKTAFREAFPKGESVKVVFKRLLDGDKLDWANWLIVRLLSRKDRIRYAIYAAEQVIDIYEKKYPDDKRPRKAIEAAKAVLKKNSKTNRDAAAAAYAAAYAAYAAAAAAAAYAAYAAAAAAAAADTACAAYAAAHAATNVAMKKQIILYGIRLLKLEVRP